MRLVLSLLSVVLLSACNGGSSSDTPTNPAAIVVDISGAQVVAGGSRQSLRAAPDPEDGSVSWQWQLQPGSITPQAIEAEANRYSYTAPEVSAPEELRLEVLRSSGESSRVTVSILPANDPQQQPQVDAGEDIQADEGDTVTLIGLATARSDRSIRQLIWQQLAGPEATILGATDRDRLALRLPAVAEQSDLRFQLTAVDSGGFKAEDQVDVTVLNTLANQPPQISVGEPKTVTGRDEVTLSATVNDVDGDVVSGEWRPLEPDGNLVVTADSSDFRMARFRAPNVAEPRTLQLQFTARDNEGAVSTATLPVTVNPAANAAPAIRRAEADPALAYSREQVGLFGMADDADNDPVIYEWVQRENAAPRVAIRDAGQPQADLILPDLSEPIDFTFELRASDGRDSSTRTVSVHGYPRQAVEPDPVACVLNPLQKGCPLYPVVPLLNADDFARCPGNPLSPDCPFADLAAADPGVLACLADPGPTQCAGVANNLADPSYVLEAIGPDEPADSCNPAYLEGIFEHYIGALHEHTAYSDGTYLSRPTDVYSRAREKGLDFAGTADHSDTLGLPISVGRGDCAPEDSFHCYLVADDERQLDAFRKWLATGEQAQTASDESFTAIRGYEWTSDRYGHANVYFSRNFINAKTGPGYAVSMARFWEWFTYPAQFGGGADGLLSFNHPGREDDVEGILENLGLGDPAFTFNDFRYVAEADYRTVGIEVFGKSDKYEYGGPLNNNGTGSWYSYALDKGWHLGPVGSEDHHGIHWGDANLPKTVLIARSVAADDLREAMLARRFYSVAQDYNGVRIDLQAAGQPMGSRIRTAPGTEIPLAVSITNEGAPMDSAVIELVSEGNTVIARATGGTLEHTLSVSDRKRYYFVRVLNAADGNTQIAFSAPVWLLPGDDALPACRPMPLLSLDSPVQVLP